MLKKSTFNIQKNNILYNTLTREKMILETEEMEKYLNNKLDEISLECLEKMITHKMIIKKLINEENLVKDIYLKESYSDQLRIFIVCTENCNFSCSYCYQDKKATGIDFNFTEVFYKFLCKNINKFSSVDIEWFGGEPLLRKRDILSLSNKINDLCKKARKLYTASMTTNGYFLNSSTFEKLLSVGINNFQITIDGTKEEHDKMRFLKNGTGTFERITKNVQEIYLNNMDNKKNFHISIRQNVTKNRDSKVFDEFFVQFKNDSRYSFFQYPIKNFGGKSINIKDRELLDTNKNTNLIEYNIPEINYFGKNNLCFASLQYGFSVFPDLKLYKCHHYKTYSINNKYNFIGSIKNDGSLVIDNDIISMWSYLNIKKECKDCPFIPTCYLQGCPLFAPEPNNYCKDNQMNNLDTILYEDSLK